MRLLFICLSLYLTGYTFVYAKLVWKKDSKPAAVAIASLMLTFLPLAIWIAYFKG